MTKIAFLVLHLGYGGAEQAVISQANLLVKKYEVEIICLYRLYETPAFYVDPKVKIVYLTEGIKPNREEFHDAIVEKNITKIIAEGVKSLKILYLRKSKMRQAVRRSTADIIISSRYLYHKLLTKNAKDGVICIAQEHNHHNGNEKYINKQIRAVRKMDYFMPVSKELTDFYAAKTKGMPVKCLYIPHYLENIPEKNSALIEKNIISVGRLVAEKNYQELIDIFYRLREKVPGWKLHIVGDGEERNKLQEKIKKYNLQNEVILHGYQNKEYIAELMYHSSIYVMTSITESFGLVLIEAQSFGVPCIAYDCAQGAKEILSSGKNGILIKNHSQERMIEELEKLMGDYQYRLRLGNEGKRNSLNYSSEAIGKQWYKFVDNIRGV